MERDHSGHSKTITQHHHRNKTDIIRAMKIYRQKMHNVFEAFDLGSPRYSDIGCFVCVMLYRVIYYSLLTTNY